MYPKEVILVMLFVAGLVATVYGMHEGEGKWVVAGFLAVLLSF